MIFVRSVRTICLLAILLPALPCAARFRLPEIEQVPVERLVRNLEAEIDQLQSSAGNSERIAATRRMLARAHALAYARGATTLDVKSGTDELFELPFGSSGLFQSLGDDVSRTETGAEHLKQALALYEMILNADRYDIPSRLGYAWALEQSGREREALEQYRRVAAATWPLERDSVTSLYAGSETLFQEAAMAVLRYLDPEKDADEIAELEDRLATFDKVGRFITPILVPLDPDDGFDRLVDTNACVAFDLDASGLARRWQWITPRAAWLVWDPEGSGRIDSGLQLFGSRTFFVFWNSGYEALRALDDDRDGRLSGTELDGLALWADSDGDGVSGPGEVRSVGDYGVVSIATASRARGQGFPFNPIGIEMIDGTTRASYDWIARSPAVGCDAATGDRS